VYVFEKVSSPNKKKNKNKNKINKLSNIGNMKLAKIQLLSKWKA